MRPLCPSSRRDAGSPLRAKLWDRREGVKERADLPPWNFESSRVCLAQRRLELAEDLFDRVEVGTVGREEQEPWRRPMRATAQVRRIVRAVDNVQTRMLITRVRSAGDGRFRTASRPFVPLPCPGSRSARAVTGSGRTCRHASAISGSWPIVRAWSEHAWLCRDRPLFAGAKPAVRRSPYGGARRSLRPVPHQQVYPSCRRQDHGSEHDQPRRLRPLG